jgi:hypothetical protein
MPRINISQLPDDSRIWIFGISPILDQSKSSRLLGAVDAFLDQWSAHGAPIVSGRDLLHGSFLVIGVDRQSETSGCSIDRMFGLLQQLERELEVAILDSNRIFYRSADGAVLAISRARFCDEGEKNMLVFDTLAERISDIRSGAWQRPAAKSWHRTLLRQAV